MREPDDDDVDDADAAGGDAGEGGVGVPRPSVRWGSRRGSVASTTRRPAPIIGQPSSRVATPRVCVYKVIMRRRRRRNNASLIITSVTTPAERAEARQD